MAVGWLEEGHQFPTGVVEGWVVRKLAKLLRKPYQPASFLGWHDCSWCGSGQSVANLWLPGEGCVYVAPEMILHYVASHDYLPPEAFLAAVRGCPAMGSLEYHERLRASGFRTREEWEADNGGLFLSLRQPGDGKRLTFRLASSAGPECVGEATYVAYDSLTDLAEAALRLLAGCGPQEVRWFVGTGEYRLLFEPSGEQVRLQVLWCSDRQSRDGEVLCEHSGPLRGVARACHHGLYRLQGSYAPERWWGYPFPGERVRQLGQALGG